MCVCCVVMRCVFMYMYMCMCVAMRPVYVYVNVYMCVYVYACSVLCCVLIVWVEHWRAETVVRPKKARR